MTQSTTTSGQRTNALQRTYAQALLELTEPAGHLDEVADEVGQLRAMLNGDDGADLKNVLTSPAISAEARQAAMDRIFQGRINPTLLQFLQVVNHKGRATEMPGIFGAFGELMDKRAGVVEAQVTVASALDDAALANLRERLGAKLGKRIELTQRVDESIIGGMVLRIGDELIDGSVASRLYSLKSKLIAAGREKARLAIAGGVE